MARKRGRPIVQGDSSIKPHEKQGIAKKRAIAHDEPLEQVQASGEAVATVKPGKSSKVVLDAAVALEVPQDGDADEGNQGEQNEGIWRGLLIAKGEEGNSSEGTGESLDVRADFVVP